MELQTFLTQKKDEVAPRHTPEIPKEEIQRFEGSILLRMFSEVVDGRGCLKRKISGGNDHSHMVSTLATDNPESVSRSTEVISDLVEKGLHEVKGYGRVMFVNLSSTISAVNGVETKTHYDVREIVGKAALEVVLNMLKESDVDLVKYPDLKRYAQSQSELGSMGFSTDYGDLFFNLLRKLGEGNGSWISPSPIHIIPVFNFGSEILPTTNSVPFDSSDTIRDLNEAAIREVSLFYRFAVAINMLQPQITVNEFPVDGYGSYGRTVIVPEFVLRVLEDLSENHLDRDLASKIEKSMGIRSTDHYNFSDHHRIFSDNAFMLEDLLKRGISFSGGHAGYHTPGKKGPF